MKKRVFVVVLIAAAFFAGLAVGNRRNPARFLVGPGRAVGIFDSTHARIGYFEWESVAWVEVESVPARERP